MKSFTIVILTLFSFVASKGIYRVKLNEEPFSRSLLVNPTAAAVEFLARKYGVVQTHFNSMDPAAAIREEGYFYTQLQQDQEILGGHQLPLENYMNTQYYITISIGTPGQTLIPILGLPIFGCQVPSARLSLAMFILSTNLWNQLLLKKTGPRLKSNMELVLSKDTSTDTLTMGGLVIKDQGFGEATEEVGIGLIFARFDGIFGLGRIKSAILDTVPPFYHLINQDLIKQNVFTFRLGKTEADSGEIVFGGIEPSFYTGEIYYAPINREASWEVSLESITLGFQKLELNNAGAIIDTGTPLIAVPTNVSEIINRQIGARKDWTGQYTVDCTSIPSLPLVSFSIGGHVLTLKPTEYILEISDICMSPFVGLDINPLSGESLWVIGHVFLRKFFTVYDVEKNRIGFALAI